MARAAFVATRATHDPEPQAQLPTRQLIPKISPAPQNPFILFTKSFIVKIWRNYKNCLRPSKKQYIDLGR